MTELAVPVNGGGATTAFVYPAATTLPPACFVLAHGAGAGQRSPFIITFATALAGLGIDVVTFNFLYTEQRRRLPDRRPLLDASYVAVVRTVHRELPSARRGLFIGGKSMGGRIATHVAAADAALPVSGVVLLGYPLHPPGKPAERRDAHLPDVKRPMLFVQGSRDAFGTPAELEPVLRTLQPAATLHVVEGGDHSFKVSSARGEAQAAVYDAVQRTMAVWITAIAAGQNRPLRG